MLNVVSEPRVMSICFPISTMSISFVGLLSRSTMLPASRAACVPVFMATPTSACASAGRVVVRAVAGHRDEVAVRLFVADAFEFRFGRGLRHEIVHAGFSRDGCGGERIVAGDHDRLDSHFAKVRKAFLDAASPRP